MIDHFRPRKPVVRRVLGLVVGLTLWAGTAGLAAHPGVGAHRDARGYPEGADPQRIAVVELFTSEGCSSCPPADELVSKLAAEAKKAAESASKNDAEPAPQVIFLAFHVDYWDRLGWKDRFATPAASQRQREIAGRHKQQSYTPAMYVRGGGSLDGELFVGSDAAKAGAAIKRAQSTAFAAAPEVSIAARKVGEPIVVDIDFPTPQKNVRVLVALVEDGLSTKVERGENEGRTLKHDRVVRVFEMAELKDGKARVTLNLPKGVEESRARIVVLVEEAKTQVMLGTSELRIVR